MAPRNVNQDTANQVIQDSFGLSADDLGMDREDALAGLEIDEDSNITDGDADDVSLDGDNLPGAGDTNLEVPPQQRQPQEKTPKEPKLDDLSVSHTPPKSEFDQGKPKFDKRGNILGSDGKVIATAGREARMYTTLHSTREKLASTIQQANSAIQATNDKLNQAVDIGIKVANQLSAMRDVGQLHTKAGLNDDDLRQAIEFASAFKKDQLGGLKMILTRAAASGIDLTQLGLQPGGFDTAALMNLVREEIGKVTAPIQQRTASETATQQQQRERDDAVKAATVELNELLTAEPEARKYLPVIQEVMKQPFATKWSLNEVWLRVKLNLLQNQQQPGGQQQDDQQRLRNRQQPRLPNGRGTPPDTGGGRVQQDELAPVDQSYEDILRGVLKAVG